MTALRAALSIVFSRLQESVPSLHFVAATAPDEEAAREVRAIADELSALARRIRELRNRTGLG